MKLYNELVHLDPSQITGSAVERFWKHSTYILVEALRRAIRLGNFEINSPKILLNILAEHIGIAEDFFNELMITMRDSGDSDWWKCAVIVGDLARYRGSYHLSSGGESETSRRWWFSKARAWYLLSRRMEPGCGIFIVSLVILAGRTYNELALLSKDKEFDSLYYLSRA